MCLLVEMCELLVNLRCVVTKIIKKINSIPYYQPLLHKQEPLEHVDIGNTCKLALPDTLVLASPWAFQCTIVF